MLETGLIPPSIHFKKGNRKIAFDEWNIRIPTALSTWPTDGARRISINSFGYGGTNVHAILDDTNHYFDSKTLAFNQCYALSDEHALNGTLNGRSNGTSNGTLNGTSNGTWNGTNGAMTNGHTTADHPRSRSRLYVWSAQDKDGLKRVREPLAKYVQAKAAKYQDQSDKSEEAFMSQLAYTLSERRSRLQWKTYAIASSTSELCASLREEVSTPVALSSRSPRIGFVFTGQGAQWPTMGSELMVYDAFRECIDAAGIYLQRVCGCPWLAAEELQKCKSISQVNSSGYSHALCTILQIALVDLLKTWGIEPTAVVGHSGGEMAAAYALGALTREDAWKVAYYRGRLSAEMKTKAPKMHGAMMAASLSQEKAVEWISKVTDGHLVVACINSPTSITISGDSMGIDQLLGMLKNEGIFARKLVVDTAYHSPHMQIIVEDYHTLISDVTPLDVQGGCIMYSSVTGGVVEARQLHADHWTTGLTSPVRFSEAIYDMLRPMRRNKRLDENAVDLLVEVGPHSALQGPSTQSLKAHNITNVVYLSVLSRNHSAIETAVSLAGSLFTQGCKVNICQVNGDGHKQFGVPLVDLPPYSWNHSQKFWHESRVDREFRSRHVPRPGLPGAPYMSAAEGERIWKGFIRPSEEPWVNDHKIHGAVLYPGAGYIAMALEAATQTADPTRRVSTYKLRDIQLTSAAIVVEGANLECIVQLRPHVAGTRDSASAWTQFIVTTSPDGKALVQNCRGLLVLEYEPADGTDASRERSLELQALKAQYVDAQEACANDLDPAGFYADMRSWGLEYGPAFANVCEVRNRDGQSVGAVRIPDIPARVDGSGRPHIIHPGTLDAVFHMAFAAVKGGSYDPSTAMVPKSIDAITISANVPFQPGTRLPGFSSAGRHGLAELVADIVMFDVKGHLPTVVVEGFLCTKITGASNSADHSARSLTSKLTWMPALGLFLPDELRFVLSQHMGVVKLVEVCVFPPRIPWCWTIT
jgi:zearalenone synthase (highly reducing iterative type I polyketide synthase)